MSRQYFGTDGIRGTANRPPMTAGVALKVGRAAGHYFLNGSHKHRVVIAKDTRLSGYLIEPALTAGFISVGMDVMLVGPLPTPAVAMLTRSLRADLGVMISASHNPYQDNGIKLFGPDGFKLTDEIEQEIEAGMDAEPAAMLAAPDKLGKATRLENARGRYMEFVKHTFPRGLRLDGMKIVIDCAHGAAYSVGPTILWELGADVIALGDKPDGFNINEGCGSTYPELLCRTVVEKGADLGIALDGDADRVVMCDEKGALIDGDQLMALVAATWHREGRLRGGGVVATQMSNLGLEQYLEGLGLTLIRTAVGDRYVAWHMRDHDFNVGGEQSGHILLTDYTTTGDGLIAALQALAVIAAQDRPVSEVARPFTPCPQVLKNLRYEGRSPLENEKVRAAIAAEEAKLNGRGRLLIRKSGTEPLIRVMAEGEDEAQITRAVDTILTSLQEEMKAAS